MTESQDKRREAFREKNARRRVARAELGSAKYREVRRARRVNGGAHGIKEAE